MTPLELARRIDHTILKPEATPDDVSRLCDEALEHHFWCVCVNPVFVRRAAERVAGSDVAVCGVVNFPLGAGSEASLADETRRVIDDGASEVDMVAWIGGLIAGEHDRVVRLIAAASGVVHASGSKRVLKVILETGALSDDQIAAGCQCARRGGADFVKTSTGFHASGGATVRHVGLLRRHASGMLVKASGGIRDFTAAMAMIEAGADRLGTSAGVAIIGQMCGSRP